MTLPVNFANRDVFWPGSAQAKSLLCDILHKDFTRAGLDFEFEPAGQDDFLEELYRYLLLNLNRTISANPSKLRALLYLVDIREDKLISHSGGPFFPLEKLCEEIIKREIKKVYFRISLQG